VIFNDKTVIVTGASAGVGAAVARRFAKLGANIVLIARGEKALEKMASELAELTNVYVHPMDVASNDACVVLIDKVIEKFGRIDVLVNNAGYHQRGDVINNQADDLAAMVDVNLRAPIMLTSLVLPYMVKNKCGAIVNVGSLAGRAPLQGAATYSATKAGLRAFSYALADEVKQSDINVGLVSPGPIDTGFIMDDMDAVEDIVFSQPLSSPEQVADAVVKVAQGKRVEISLPAFSGFLTTIVYLLPWLRRKTRPALYRKGRRAKARIAQQKKSGG